MTASETTEKRRLRLVGVPMDLGASRRGVDMGPSAIRIAGLSQRLREIGYEVEDDGDVGVPTPETLGLGDASARYLEPIYQVCDDLRLRVRKALEHGDIPVVLGGDHSIAIGTVSGVSEHFREKGESVGLIWVDAHGDMNTPQSSPSGNIHGMPLATVLGLGHPKLVEMGGFSPKVQQANVVLIGIRDIDNNERKIIRESGIHAYTMRDVDERGIGSIMKEAIELTSNGTAGFHMSFDLDSMDPRDVPGTGTPVKGGLDWREANLLMEMASDSGKMRSLEITELNPILDVQNQSGEVAVDVICSAFGKRIL